MSKLLKSRDSTCFQDYNFSFFFFSFFFTSLYAYCIEALSTKSLISQVFRGHVSQYEIKIHLSKNRFLFNIVELIF